MHLARLAGLDDEADRGAQARADQVMMHGGAGEQRRDRIRSAPAMRSDRMMMLTPSRTAAFGARAELVERLLHARRAEAGMEGGVERPRLEMRVRDVGDRADLLQVRVGQDRLAHLQPLGRGDALAGRTGSAAAR